MDWFWTWGPMAWLQDIVDRSRESAPDPLTLITVAACLVLLVIWLLARSRAEGNAPIPGETYLGKITPKTIQSMTKNTRVVKPKSREDAIRTLSSRKRR